MKYTEINHWSHEHKLVLEEPEVPYICWGCKQLGFTPCYQCKSCNFHLHEECAHAKPSASHDFLKKCKFVFYHDPPTLSRRFCDACGDDIEGFRYQCTHERPNGHDLHPCCLKLPRTLTNVSTGTSIRLSENTKSACVWCKNRHVNQWTKGWCYVSSSGERFHIACFRQAMLENWKKEYFGISQLQGDYRAGSGCELMTTEGNAGQMTIVKHGRWGKTIMVLSKMFWFARLLISAFFGDLSPIFVALFTQSLPQ